MGRTRGGRPWQRNLSNEGRVARSSDCTAASTAFDTIDAWEGEKTGLRRKASRRPPRSSRAAERRSRSGVYRIPRAERTRRRDERSHAGMRAMRRGLPWVAAIYVGAAIYEGSALGPMAPSVVAAGASALSMSVVAIMAHLEMLRLTPLVALGSLTAATYAWSSACLATAFDGSQSFVLTVLGGAFLLYRARHMVVLLAAVGLAYGAAVLAAAIRPAEVAFELAAASTVALGLAAVHEARARLSAAAARDAQLPGRTPRTTMEPRPTSTLTLASDSSSSRPRRTS